LIRFFIQSAIRTNGLTSAHSGTPTRLSIVRMVSTLMLMIRWTRFLVSNGDVWRDEAVPRRRANSLLN